MEKVNSYLRLIVNKIKGFESDRSIFYLIKLLKSDNSIPKFKYSPFQLLLLINWFIVFSGRNRHQKFLNREELNKLYNKTLRQA